MGDYVSLPIFEFYFYVFYGQNYFLKLSGILERKSTQNSEKNEGLTLQYNIDHLEVTLNMGISFVLPF